MASLLFVFVHAARRLGGFSLHHADGWLCDKCRNQASLTMSAVSSSF
jgi:hypothetical protein